jgi:anion-transporting  ArsA/GET3 family ATPase
VTTAAPARSPFGVLVEQRHIIVCAGSGGVGKTTTAAVLAVEGARRGRRSVVVTIDPAKRLANALGLASLSDVAHEIPREMWDPRHAAPPGGSLSALMLDTKSTFDHLVHKYAGGGEQAERILANRFYRNVSSALSGTQEYMAMEKLHELHEEGGYELIVVDTPPTRNALDFLDAPRRLTRLLDNRLFRLLMTPTRAYLRATGFALQTFLRTIARTVGSEVIDDLVAFFHAFEGMEEGFRARAQRVLALLEDPRTSFVLITSPRRDAVQEAEFFARVLAESDVPVEGLIVNRIHPRFGIEQSAGLDTRAALLGARDGDAGQRLASLYANLADFQQISEREARHLEGITNRVGSASIAHIPFLARDVCDFEGLAEIAQHLFKPAE